MIDFGIKLIFLIVKDFYYLFIYLWIIYIYIYIYI